MDSNSGQLRILPRVGLGGEADRTLLGEFPKIRGTLGFLSRVAIRVLQGFRVSENSGYHTLRSL